MISSLQSSFDFETPGQPNGRSAVPQARPSWPGKPGIQSGGVHREHRTARHYRQCTENDLLRARNQQLGNRLSKNYTDRRTAQLEFRGELFNAFNHAQFFQPDGNFTDGSDFRACEARAGSSRGAVRAEVVLLAEAKPTEKRWSATRRSPRPSYAQKFRFDPY